MTTPHAVRWARRIVGKEFDYTRWHLTRDASFTVCGRPIKLTFDNGTSLPESNDDLARVTCKACLRKEGRLT
jgi:hypothetical protein